MLWANSAAIGALGIGSAAIGALGIGSAAIGVLGIGGAGTVRGSRGSSLISVLIWPEGEGVEST